MPTTLFAGTDADPRATTVPPSEADSHRQRLATALPDLSHMEGAPVASADQVLDVSLPPYYTACPSPFAGEVAAARRSPTAEAESDGFEVAAFGADVSVGKNDPLYFAHYYSTKVPPGAIVPYILHFTRPGDVVLDAFCGTGMTGVAAQLCAKEGDGARRAILSDLSPAASFIAAGTNAIGALAEHLDAIEEIVATVARDHAGLLRTAHVGWPRGTTDPNQRVNVGGEHNMDGRRSQGRPYGHIQYVVWSDVFSCSACGRRTVYWDLVFRGPKQRTPKEAPCPGCGSLQSIRTLERSWTTWFDPDLDALVRQAEQQPVLINYSVGKQRFEKKPDDADVTLIQALAEPPIRPAPPIVAMPDGFNTQQPRQSHGFTHLHHFFTRRNLVLLREFWVRVRDLKNREARFLGLFVLTGALQRVCRLNRYMPNHDRHVGPLSGTLYVAPLTAEIPATNYLQSRIADLRRCGGGPRGNGVVVGTQSATDLRNVPDASVDYVFTDPPFGGNLNYSELNTLVEGWLGIRTDPRPEAVVNQVQGKSLADYRRLMLAAFREYFRVLKPGRWVTVEFHNSQNAVWVAIQEALSEAGFVVADARVLDKKKGTTKQLSYGSTVQQDLAISAYKPRDEVEARARLRTGHEDDVWDFVRMHLSKIGSPEVRNGTLTTVAERHNYLLFDRMVAFYVQRGVLVPISAAEFYRGLAERFPDRHGQYFLPEQVAEYDRQVADGPVAHLQMELFVRDEESAIRWLRQTLSDRPQTFQELHPRFTRKTTGWSKHERPMELSDLLDQNFLADEADCWHVPDRSKEIDLVRLRERSLLREFAEYTKAHDGRLKVFRTEAVRAGFRQAWQKKDYATVVTVARKLPDSVLREDPKLLMWLDQAVVRAEKLVSKQQHQPTHVTDQESHSMDKKPARHETSKAMAAHRVAEQVALGKDAWCAVRHVCSEMSSIACALNTNCTEPSEEKIRDGVLGKTQRTIPGYVIDIFSNAAMSLLHVLFLDKIRDSDGHKRHLLAAAQLRPEFKSIRLGNHKPFAMIMHDNLNIGWAFDSLSGVRVSGQRVLFSPTIALDDSIMQHRDEWITNHLLTIQDRTGKYAYTAEDLIRLMRNNRFQHVFVGTPKPKPRRLFELYYTTDAASPMRQYLREIVFVLANEALRALSAADEKLAPFIGRPWMFSLQRDVVLCHYSAPSKKIRRLVSGQGQSRDYTFLTEEDEKALNEKWQ